MTEDVDRLTVGEVLAAIAAPLPTSGAGIAAALALALAAACARKAVGVTLKHRDARELHEIEANLSLLQHRAVAQARRDQVLFQSYLETKQPAQAERLVDSSRHFQQLILDVGNDLERLPELIADNVSGDLEAARALHRAAGDIAADLLREARAVV